MSGSTKKSPDENESGAADPEIAVTSRPAPGTALVPYVPAPKSVGRPKGSPTISATSRIPEEVDGIQTNFCRNPDCINYGVAPGPATRGRAPAGVTRGPWGRYRLTGRFYERAIICVACERSSPLKSNHAVSDELKRLRGYLGRPEHKPAHKDGCPHVESSIESHPDHFRKFGKTAKGHPRFQCLGCAKTVAIVPRASTLGRQVRSEKNADIFRALVNSSALSRTCEMLDISPKLLYDRIDFIHERCLEFAGHRETQILERDLFEGKRLDFCMDRQIFVVNWRRKLERKNSLIHAVCVCERKSGYVLGTYLNYDPSADREKIVEAAKKCGDPEKPPPYRRYARVWLDDEILAQKDAALASAKKRMATDELAAGFDHASVLFDIGREYADAMARADVEHSEVILPGIHQLPSGGTLVHEQYVIYAAMRLLEEFTRSARRVTVYMDQDSGFRAGFLAAFTERVRAKTAHAFYVDYGKELNTVEKKAAFDKTAQALQEAADDLGVSPIEAAMELVKAYRASPRLVGPWKDEWIDHPLPNVGEPNKMIAWLTKDVSMQERDMLWMHLRATLNPLDTWFNVVRRRLRAAERGVRSSRSSATVWHLYASYRPDMVGKLLDILRVYYNYCPRPPKKGKPTPAMRLGLAQGPVRPQDILYFKR